MKPNTGHFPLSEKPHSLRNGIFCCLIFLACLLLAWPVSKLGFIDEWAYFKTAQEFLRTGHIVYNGWAAPILGWLVPWGGLFIKLFGSSYMAGRLSVLATTLLTLLLFHSILRRFGITPRNAIIGTLTLGLSPLFLPLSAVYMTDAPCLFVVVLCLYLCQRAASASTPRAAIAWLILAAASNVTGGTVRQAAWLGALVMIPCTGWMLRKHRAVFVTAMALWVASIGAIACCMHWFAQQPYVAPVPILPRMPGSLLLGAYDAILSMNLMGALALTLLLVIFPVLAAWLPRFGKKFDHYIVLFCMGLLPMLTLKFLCGRFGVIWPAIILNMEFSASKDPSLGNVAYTQPSLFPDPVRVIISVITVAALLGCIIAIRNKGWKNIRSENPEQSRQILWLLIPFSLAYFGLMLLAVWHWLPFDRYMIDVMPFAILGSIWLYQRCIKPELPAASVALLIVFAIFGIAGTHSWFAWCRARMTAIQELRAAGIPRTEIQAGFAYDGQTQLEMTGYINNSAIKNPPNAYKPPARPLDINNLCNYLFLPDIPNVHPKYAVAFGPKECYLPSSFPAVHYTAWLPPFHRVVYIREVPSTPRTILLNHR